MNRIIEMQQERGKAIEAAAAILQKAKDAERDLTGAEEMEFNKLHKEAEDLRRRIAIAEHSQEMEAVAGLGFSLSRRSGSEGDLIRRATTQPKSREVRELALGLAIRGWFTGDRAAREKACDLLDIGSEQRVALQEGSATEGGTMVPALVSSEILRGEQPGVVRPLCREFPMDSSTLTIPRLDSPPTVAIIAEEGQITDGFGADPVGGAVLTAKKLITMVTCSNELLSDSVVAVGAFLLDSVVEAIGQMEDQQILEGDSSGQEFTGILAAVGTSEVVVDAALTTLDPFIEALSLLATASPRYFQEATFVMSPMAYLKVQSLKHPGYSGDTAGLFQMTSDPSASSPLSLLGRPVVLCNQIVNGSGTGSNESTIYCGAFKRGMAIGNRNAVELFRDPFSLLDTFQTRIVVGERIGITVAVPAAFCKITGVEVQASS